MSENIDKKAYYAILFEYYKELLTDKQKEFFEDYYFSNLSLGEIAENTGLSRNAIHKNIKTVEDKLNFYEEKLELYKKRLELEEIIKEIDNKNIIDKLQNLYWGVLWQVENIKCIMITQKELKVAS